MKKLIISLVVSAPLLLAAPSFAASSSELSNPLHRTDSTYSVGYKQLPNAGASYAWWHRGGHWRWHRWHRGGWGWHRWHHRYW